MSPRHWRRILCEDGAINGQFTPDLDADEYEQLLRTREELLKVRVMIDEIQLFSGKPGVLCSPTG